MKYILFGIMFLMVGCSNWKPVAFVCMTPFGVAQIHAENPDLQVFGSFLQMHTDTATYRISRSVCMEVMQ